MAQSTVVSLHTNGDSSGESVVQDDTSSSGANRSESHDRSSSECFTAISMFLLTEEDFSDNAFRDINVDNDELKKLRVTRMSPEVRKMLRFFGDSNHAAEIIFLANKACKESPCTQVLPLPPLVNVFPNTSRSGLFATRIIEQGEFIIAPAPVLITAPDECGRVCGVLRKNHVLFGGLQNDFSHYQVVVPTINRKRKRDSDQFLERKKLRVEKEKNKKKRAFEPSPRYYSDDEDDFPKVYDKYDMCIDLSDSTDELKAIRRNCVPNCVIRYVILHQRLEMFITARRQIKAGEELTLHHDYDSNLSSKVIQCAHPYQPGDLCLHEKERQDTIRNYVRAMTDDSRPSTSSTD